MSVRRFSALAVLCLLCLVLAAPCPAQAKPLVLVIGSYHADYPWQASYRKGLEETLGQAAQLRFFDMDTKRLPEKDHPASAEKAWSLYRSLKPDLVVLGDDAALMFLGPRLQETSTPCVYLGINANPRTYVHGAKNITGVLERPLFLRNILFIKEIMGPGLKKGLILFDTDTTSKVLREEPFQNRESMAMAGILMDLKLIGTLEEWRRAVLQARQDGYDLILLGLYHTVFDAKGNHVDSEELLRWTSRHAPVPLFCFWDFTVGPEGAIGGMVLFGEVQGRMAGDMALRILGGEDPWRIFPVIAEKGRFLFSRSQLARWGLTLPPDIASQAEFTE